MLILASKSPRRKELLSVITKDFIIKSANVDETLPDGISPDEAVKYLSAIKAQPLKKRHGHNYRSGHRSGCRRKNTGQTCRRI